MWKRAAVVLFGIMLIFALGVAVLAQDANLLGRFVPFVIDVEQTVPVVVSVPMKVDSGETITATVPISVSVALQVRVDGPGAAVVVENASDPVVAVATATPLAKSGAADNSASPLDKYGVAKWEGAETIEREGIVITLNSVFVADWIAMQNSESPQIREFVSFINDSTDEYESKLWLILLSLRIENTNKNTYSIDPIHDGQLLIGTHQIDIVDFLWANPSSMSGEILPGAVKEDLIGVGADFDAAVFAEPVNFLLRVERPLKDGYLQGEEDFLIPLKLEPVE